MLWGSTKKRKFEAVKVYKKVGGRRGTETLMYHCCGRHNSSSRSAALEAGLRWSLCSED